MTPDFWLSDAGKELHERLAKLAGWERVAYSAEPEIGIYRDSHWENSGQRICFDLPSPSELIRQLERGMSEEQQMRYAGKIGYGLAKANISHRAFWFQLITAPDEIRGKAIVEVMASPSENT